MLLFRQLFTVHCSLFTLLPKVHRTRAAVARALRDPLAHDPVAVRRDEPVEPVAELSDARYVVDVGYGAEDWERREGARNRLRAPVDTPVRRDQVHRFHAGVVGDPGEALEHARVVEAQPLDV